MTTTTRRAMLGAIGSIAAAGFISGHAARAAAIPAIPTDGGRWTRLKARYDRIVAAVADYDRATYRPAWAANDAAAERVPHVTAEYPGWTWKHGVRQNYQLTTAKWDDVCQAREALGRCDGFEAEYVDACRQIVAGADERSETLTQIEHDHNIPAITGHFDRLGELEWKLKWRLMETPAPDLSGALWKFDQLLEMDGSQTPCWNLDDEQVSAAIADVRRLLGGEVRA